MLDTKVSILLVYEPFGKRPVTVARVDSTSLLLRVAEPAIGEAEARAALLAEADKVLGQVEREEVKRLERVLRSLLPELSKEARWPKEGNGSATDRER
jgi:hypothetical protein